MNTNSNSTHETIGSAIVESGYQLHSNAGPGLLESVYEVTLAKMLIDLGYSVKRQVPVPINLMGQKFDEGFRADIIVENKIIIELKSVENIAPVHSKQLLTYSRLTNSKLGFLINFGASTFRECVQRIVNNY